MSRQSNYRNSRDYSKLLKQQHSDYPIYVAEVMSTYDVNHTGMIKVFISGLGVDRNKPETYIDCYWSSTFAGSTNPTSVGQNTAVYAETMKSYGFWAVPPDSGNLVLVCFARDNNNLSIPFVIGCIFPDQMANMVPGIPAGTTNAEQSLPVAEKNRRDENKSHKNTVPRPIHNPITQALAKQGLINDEKRGTTTAGSRRESPSEVFGMLTPGPRDPDNYDNRLGGHSFVLDDNLNQQHIRLRTAGGNQILMDDTEGMIYVINRDGTAWVELAKDGSIHVFSNNHINLRAKGNFNLRADNDINIEAGNALRLRSIENDIKLESEKDITSFAKNKIKQKSIKDFTVKSGASMLLESSLAASIKTDQALTVESGRYTSFKAGDYGVFQSDGPLYLRGATVNLNNGGIAIPSIPASDVDPMMQWGFFDLPEGEIPFQEAQDAETEVLPTNGERPGTPAFTTTITDVLVTAEPWFGHHKIDPIPVKQSSSGLGGKLGKIASFAVSAADSLPSPVVGPEGVSVGVGIAGDGSPIYKTVTDVSNKISSVKSKVETFANNPALRSVVKLAAVAAPYLGFPAVSPFAEAFLGYGHQLSPLEQSLNKIGLKDGNFVDLGNKVFGDVANEIATKTKEQLEASGFNFLDEVTILSPDGVTFFDTTKQLTGAAASAILGADMKATAEKIAGDIGGVSLTDNQFSSVVSFAHDIGRENWLNSDVKSAIEQGNLAKVPNLMQQFSFGTKQPGGDSVFLEELKQRREYEGGLFGLPDDTQIQVNDQMSGLGYGALSQQTQKAKNDLVARAGGPVNADDAG